MITKPIPLPGPLALRIAADAQRGPTDYVNDHIWEVVFGGQPPALALATAFGRRAVGMRIYPSFGMGGPIATDPRVYAEPAQLEALLPSYLRLRFSPLSGLEVVAEYRVHDSQTVASRLTLVNATDHFRPVRLGLHAELRALPGGQGMLPRAYAGVTTLAGKTGGLEPVVFLAGGAIEDPGASSALIVRADLAPGARRSFTWAEAALADGAVSFSRAREVASQPWDAAVARLERIHARWVDVESGDAAWDAGFHYAQQAALAAFVGPGPLSPHRTFVLERTPERGYSVSGDGRDYGESWVGPSALEAYFVLGQMLWAAPELAAEVLRTFFDAQSADGGIDARPGLAAQRARRLCPPLLATLALRVHEVLGEDPFLEDAFRVLWPSFRVWLSPSHDRDGDGWPEWDHPLHLPWPMGWSRSGSPIWFDTAAVEDPGLIALLYREATSLETIAARLGRDEVARELSARRSQLRGLLQRSWSEAQSTFLRIERDGHRTSTGESIAAGAGPGKARAKGKLKVAGRLAFRVAGSEAEVSRAQVRIRGRLESGRVRVETLSPARIRWLDERGWATTDLVFAAIESVEVRNIPPEAGWSLTTLELDGEDLTLLLPLWAGMVEPQPAAAIIGKLLSPEGYLRGAGLGLRPAEGMAEPAEIPVVLNLLLAEALVAYGRRQEAADLLDRLMAPSTGELEAQQASGPGGSKNPADSPPGGTVLRLPPLSLFLDVLGVGLRSPTSVDLQGASPFGSPVVVRWRGLEITKGRGETTVRFPSGVTTRVSTPDPVVVDEVRPLSPDDPG